MDMPFLWGYSDLFTTFPSPFFSSNHSFARPHCWSFITDTAVPPSLSSIFSCSCLCLLDSLPCCLLTALAFLGSSPSTLYSVQFVITSFIPFHLYHLNACILNGLFPLCFQLSIQSAHLCWKLGLYFVFSLIPHLSSVCSIHSKLVPFGELMELFQLSEITYW